MGFTIVDPADVGNIGVLWLLLTYGYVLFQASNLISEGSDLLLLVPSLAGLVGGVVLPLLGAVPDGAIMLFSGLGNIEEAQENLSVGVGALAGSTIMLLTGSWALCVFGGRVDLSGPDRVPNYLGKPKLDTSKSCIDALKNTGVDLSPQINSGATIMMFTTISYLVIQIPGYYLKNADGGDDNGSLGTKEKVWAILAFVICISSFVTYLYMQYKMSQLGENIDKVVSVMADSIRDDKISLKACIFDYFRVMDRTQKRLTQSMRELGYGSMQEDTDLRAQPLLRAILRPLFIKHDVNNDKHLQKDEIQDIFLSMHEKNHKQFVDKMFEQYDINGDGQLSFDEFVTASYEIFKKDFAEDANNISPHSHIEEDREYGELSPDEEEEEDVPEDLTNLSPQEQQRAIKKRAFTMLFIGTALVVLFSDPMVDVLVEMSKRMDIPPFYVSFALVPLASNASEVIASSYYASKKTRKSIEISLSALEGAASMNNTFCLAIFMGLIIFRGIAWQYTAETIVIVLVQLIMGFMAKRGKMTYLEGWLVLLLLPLSMFLVAFLEKVCGLD